ncbi:MAG: 3-hydroxybutyryl-CoA dehydrogenase [Chitinophagaceae bacterium]|nr:3-hydroxybutyryl-CoA dehydrogenase [Chitinophagaceae bacterium]
MAAMHQAIKTVCVCGAGTMGSGIAQVMAQGGYSTLLFDLNEAVLEKARSSIYTSLSGFAAKGRITPEERERIFSRLTFSNNIQTCAADLVIEAIIEDAAAKEHLFQQLAAINEPHTIFATNTSSLSVSAIAEKLPQAARFAGMHFFNPAPLMKLVEVVEGEQTSGEIIETMRSLIKGLGKTPVVCKDAPGFIVNRVARHYYLEALKMAEEHLADFETIDALLESAGFKMGPFRLMDLIGNDINLAVTTSLYEACGKPARLRPSAIQMMKVQAGELGRKTGKGYYTYE